MSLFFFSISPLTIGGILLMVASYYIYIGNIKVSTIYYSIADIMWLSNAINNKDYFGALAIGIGITSSVLVMYKISAGIFVQNLKKD